MTLVDQYTDQLVADIGDGLSLGAAMVNLTLEHAERLRELGPVRVLAHDPCPLCGGSVIASETEARCGCGWSYRRPA